jgi:hypothetical protein
MSFTISFVKEKFDFKSPSRIKMVLFIQYDRKYCIDLPRIIPSLQFWAVLSWHKIGGINLYDKQTPQYYKYEELFILNEPIRI